MAPFPGPYSGVSTLAFVARASALTFGVVYGSFKLSYLKGKAKFLKRWRRVITEGPMADVRPVLCFFFAAYSIALFAARCSAQICFLFTHLNPEKGLLT